jgi:hypothetical protein
MLLTDFCNRPCDTCTRGIVRFPSAQGEPCTDRFARAPTEAGKPGRCTRRTAPDRVSAIRPRVSARLTPRVQRWPSRSRRRPRHFWRTRTAGSTHRQSPLTPALSAVRAVGGTRLWRFLSRSVPLPPGGASIAERRGPSPPPHRQAGRPPRPEAPSIDTCLREPAPSANTTETRHRSRGFAACDPASGARSPSPCSRRERLDPTSCPSALHRWPRRAARRVSTSAIENDLRARPRIVRTSRTTPVVAHLRSVLSRAALPARDG